MKRLSEIIGGFWSKRPDLQEIEQRMANLSQLESVNFCKQQAIEEASARNEKPPDGVFGGKECTVCKMKRVVYYVHQHPVAGAACARLFPIYDKPCICVMQYYVKDDYGNYRRKPKHEVPTWLGGNFKIIPDVCNKHMPRG
ncbi:MAG: hypothetical protein FWC80_01385 [Firmicutes bacterium]|nr:hypothetical protein [Bacillota bacterium]